MELGVGGGCSNSNSNSNSIYKVSREIKKKEQSLYNALRSVYEDSRFISEIRGLWPCLPLLANLRCGLWYAPRFDATCYFKSTDGHTGNCSFSATRLNIHVALLAAERGGCFIVDATRRGKRFPDSMSKTIPIWTCVLNRALLDYKNKTPDSLEDYSSSTTTFKESSESCSTLAEWDCSLHLPVWVSKTEKDNIENHMDNWVKLFKSTGVDLAPLVKTMKKPLRPLWISQKTRIWLNEVPDVVNWPFTPIILVSASMPVSTFQRMNDGMFDWNYIPGAADDEESWARGLTPPLFWKHAHELVDDRPENCNMRVATIVERDRVYRGQRGLESSQIKISRKGLKNIEAGLKEENLEQLEPFIVPAELGPPGLLHWIGETRLAVGDATFGQIESIAEYVNSAINCGVTSVTEQHSLPDDSYLYLPIKSSKVDRFSLQNHLSEAVSFATQKLKQGLTVAVFCSDGEDISVCVCLAILLSQGNERSGEESNTELAIDLVSKSEVRRCLARICSFVVNARPCRGNLKQVYNFLINGTLQKCQFDAVIL